jgi:ubiquinone/menaquinone biosynthesis C-methylase UbiE
MDSEERFSDRVENYILYRPQYPGEVYAFLQEKGLISPESIVADVGCGTGISSKLFLEKGHKVFGVEPNRPMLQAAENAFKGNDLFIPVPAPAEKTTLSDHSVDLVVCAQAFHWFDRENAKKEFKRILKEEGKVLLLWNERRTEGEDFLQVYEDFLKMFGTDYKEVDHRQAQAENVLGSFFNGNYLCASFDNFQKLDLQGLKGRILSASYMPGPGHADHDFMMYCLKKIFNRYEENGKVTLVYDTRVYAGSI